MTFGARLDSLRWRDRLAVRLVVVINATAVGVLAAFWFYDYHRESQVHFDQEVARLREEAKVLRVAANVLPNREAIQHYVDLYCRQMERHASPGHHILVLDAEGRPWVRAHKNADAQLEREMKASRHDPFRTFRYGGEDFVVVSLPQGGRTILVTQSLAPAQRIIRAQAISRAASVAVMGILILLTTLMVLWRWVSLPVWNLVRGVEAITGRRFDHRVSSDGSGEFQFLAHGFNRMADALGRVELRRQREMERAREIQAALLPARMPAIPGATVVVRYIPTDVVGGDYYDVLEYANGRWLLVVADVCGHGVAAALLTALLKALVQQQVELGSPLAAIARTLDARLGEVAAATGGFATCFLAAYEPSNGDFEYLSAGHEAAYHFQACAEGLPRVQPLSATGLPLGVNGPSNLTIRTTRLEPGDRVLVYTDGLPESFDADEVPFSRDRFQALARNTACLAPEVQLDRILAVMSLFRGKQSFVDDVTLLLVSREGDS